MVSAQKSQPLEIKSIRRGETPGLNASIRPKIPNRTQSASKKKTMSEEQKTRYRNLRTQLKEEQEKKNTALRKIQETLDEVKEELDDGLFLQMMNLIKDNYVVNPQ